MIREPAYGSRPDTRAPADAAPGLPGEFTVTATMDVTPAAKTNDDVREAADGERPCGDNAGE